jgi:hypothetical protein
MRQIRITDITGVTYPVNVYVSDLNGNNESFLGIITSATAPNPYFTNVTYTTYVTNRTYYIYIYIELSIYIYIYIYIYI